MRITRQARGAGMHRIVLLALLALAPACVSRAYHAPAHPELEAANRRVHELVNEAEHWADQGWEGRAGELFAEAERLQAEIGHMQSRVERRPPHGGMSEQQALLAGLEHGMEALHRLGRLEELRMLERVMDETRAEFQGRRLPREHDGERSLDAMRLGVEIFMEFEARDRADMLEHALHARRLTLEGRNDPEARQVRETAPSPGNTYELMMAASRLWAEAGHEERAHFVRETAEQLRHGAERLGDEEAMQRLELLHLVRSAWLEAERPEPAEAVSRAIRALEVALEGRTDDESHAIRERAPGIGGQLELAVGAQEILQDFGALEQADRLGPLVQSLRHAWEDERAEREHGPNEAGHVGERLEQMESALRELAAAMEQLQEQLAVLRAEQG